jgi:CreA protein
MNERLKRHREARQRRGDPMQLAQRARLRPLDCFGAMPLAMTLRKGLMIAGIFALPASAALADDISCVSTTFRLVGRNDQVCVSAFDDPKVPGVACHISQARTGGLGGSLGLSEDPSRFSISCRQIGPITADIEKLGDHEKVYSEHTSIFFKHTNVFRIVDKKRNTLVYLAISDKLIEGSPQNAISTVPIMPWASAR